MQLPWDFPCWQYTRWPPISGDCLSQVTANTGSTVYLKDFKSTVALTFATSKVLYLRHCPCTHKYVTWFKVVYSKRLPRWNFMLESQLQSPLFYLKIKQPNVPFLSGRLQDLVRWLGKLSPISLAQRPFFCGDFIAITPWAPDVVNLVHPISPTLSGSSAL